MFIIVYHIREMTTSRSAASALSGSPTIRKSGGAAFLLAQVGAHAAAQFAERLASLKMISPQAGILRLIRASEGLSQQALALQLGIVPSRLVTLIDELEQRGLVQRRDHPEDRRSYALHLTEKGREMLTAIGRIAREHQEALCAALTDDEREVLASLLQRIADDQGLRHGVHPGFARMKG
jgi:DNA-binding MarR family transcriptional regulator